MRWWRLRPVGLIYVGKDLCSGDMVERWRRIEALDKQDPPKVARFPVVTTGQAQQRKQA